MSQLFKPKFFSLLKAGISRKQVSQDLMAGIIVGIVALPLAIAFAVASGVSPEKGLITAVIAGFLISFLGGSRVQIGGPTGAFIVIVYGIVQEYGIDGLIISTMLAGVFLLGFGLLRLGSLLKFFPRPLIVGFTSGIAVVIFTSQIKDALGLDVMNIPAEFIPKWKLFLQNLHSVNLVAIAITAGTIGLILLAKRFTKRIPGSFLALLAATILVQLLDLPVNTIQSFFGDIPATFHFTLPVVDFSNLANYIRPALTIALLGAIESLLSAVVADGMIGGNHRSNTELIAQGIANMVTPFFGGIPATGAIARTATNVNSGGRTPIAGMSHAVTLLLILLFFGKWARLIPMSALAGVLIVVAYNMSEWRSFVSILRGSVFDILILLTTFVLTVLVDLTVAIEIGVVLSSLLFMKRMADVGNKTLSLDIDSDLIEDYSSLDPEISVYEISGPLFFASAKQYAEVLKVAGRRGRILIIRMRHVPFIDATGLHNFNEALRTLKSSGTRIILSGVHPEVQKVLDKNRISFLVGKANVCDSFESALVRAKNLAGKE